MFLHAGTTRCLRQRYSAFRVLRCRGRARTLGQISLRSLWPPQALSSVPTRRHAHYPVIYASAFGRLMPEKPRRPRPLKCSVENMSKKGSVYHKGRMPAMNRSLICTGVMGMFGTSAFFARIMACMKRGPFPPDFRAFNNSSAVETFDVFLIP